MTKWVFDEVLRQLNYNKDTGEFTWKISTNSNIKVGQKAGSLKEGYIRIKINKKSYYAHRLVWLLETGNFPDKILDHINRNKLDNRFINLREVTKAENVQNKINPSKNNKTGYLGVSPDNETHKFRAYIMVNGKSTFLGSYDTPEQAHEVYLKEKKRIHHAFSF